LSNKQVSNTQLEGLQTLFANYSFSIQFFEDYEQKYHEEFGRMEPFRHGHFYYLKVMAMTCSKFQTVLYVDDDAFLLRDPLYLLEHEEMKKKGAMFWHDMYGIHP